MSNLNNRQQSAVQNAQSFYKWIWLTYLIHNKLICLMHNKEYNLCLQTGAAENNAAKQFNATHRIK